MLKKILAVTVGVVIVACVLVPYLDDASIEGDNTLDVIILGGQSNAAYTLGTPRVDVDVTNQEIPIPDTDCFYFGTSSRPVYHSTDLSGCQIRPMVVDDLWHIGSEEAPIAYQVSQKTNDDVLIINTAIPGQPIANLAPNGEYGERIKDTLELALSKIPSSYNQIRCGWVWIQGEADKSTSLDDYVASFHEIQSFYAEYGFDTCYLVKTRASDSGNATTAQDWLIANVPNVIMASDAPDSFSVADGTLVQGNEIHYTQKGRDIVGLEVGSAIADNLNSHLRSTGSPEILKAIPAIIIASLVLASVGFVYQKKVDA